MSLFNVHVNRTPVTGEIKKIEIQKGHYWPFLWFIRRGTEENTRQTIYISNSIGEFRVIQIVGAIARRVKIYFSPGDQVNQGERLGMISYGSEVDLEFPVDKYKILVQEGTNTMAGITPLAERTK
jgi:phosphatidylserine decarboxylase